MPDVKLSWEPWPMFWPDAKLLCEEEWSEYKSVLGLFLPFRLDAEALAGLWKMNLLHLYVARVNGAVGGYILWTLDKDPETSSPMLRQGPWYVRRRNRMSISGRRLFDESLRDMLALFPSVEQIDLHCPPFGRGKRLELLFKRLGAIPVATHYRLARKALPHA